MSHLAPPSDPRRRAAWLNARAAACRAARACGAPQHVGPPRAAKSARREGFNTNSAGRLAYWGGCGGACPGGPGCGGPACLAGGAPAPAPAGDSRPRCLCCSDSGERPIHAAPHGGAGECQCPDAASRKARAAGCYAPYGDAAYYLQNGWIPSWAAAPYEVVANTAGALAGTGTLLRA